MGAKTKKIILSVIYTLLLIPSAGLSIFGFSGWRDFIAEGDSGMAAFTVKMGFLFLACALFFSGAIVYTWKRGFRAEEIYENSENTPLFRRWFLREYEGIRQKWGRLRAVINAMRVLMTLVMLVNLIFWLEEGPGWGGFAILVLYVIIFWYLGHVSSYHKKYIRPLQAAVDRELPTDTEKEAFAGQILGRERREFLYQGTPGSVYCKGIVLPDYCFLRHPGKCCLIKNRDIRNVTLDSRAYTAGPRLHVRSCYVMEIYTENGGEKPYFQAYFAKKEEMEKAASAIRETGLPAGADYLLR